MKVAYGIYQVGIVYNVKLCMTVSLGDRAIIKWDPMEITHSTRPRRRGSRAIELNAKEPGASLKPIRLRLTIFQSQTMIFMYQGKRAT